MQNEKIRFVLTGTLTGHTTLLGKHAFVKGECDILVGPENIRAVLTFLARSYQAFPQGSPELEMAQKRDRENGLLSDLPPNPAPTDGASAPVQGAGDHDAGPLPDSRALHSGVDAPGETGSEGMVPGGPGHENAGLGERVESAENRESDALMATVRVAVSKLDPKVDEQWSDSGLPSVEYVADAVKNPTVTRELISMACPDWTRIKAEDLAGL